MCPRRRPSPILPLLLFPFLLIITTQPTTSSASSILPQLHSLISLSHSLATRIANLRASRGDTAGSLRANLIAEKISQGLGFGFVGAVWSVGWDYVRNYVWRERNEAGVGIMRDANELMRLVSEVSGLGSDSERLAWVGRNYQLVLDLLKKLFRRLLSVFTKSGPMREIVEILQRELEGDLLRDCLELGAGDLKGLIQIFRDMASQYASAPKQDL